MAKKQKRKKYPRLPSGFGSIRYLGAGRRNCYSVTPAATIDALGRTVRPTPICYVDDWYKGFAVLTAYKAGTYTPGMEKTLGIALTSDRDPFVERVLADLSMIKGIDDKNPNAHEKTFAEVFDDFWKWKFERPEAKKLSPQTRRSTRAAYKNCKPLWERPFCQIKATELQSHLDSVKLKHSSLALILSLYHQLYAYADLAEICKEDRSKHISINIPADDIHGIPLSGSDLQILWKNREDENVQMILIMCYSGFRITEYKEIDVHLEEGYFQGGIKTASGKNRVVPIHSAIKEFVTARMEKYGCLLPISTQCFREKKFAPTLDRLGIFSDPPHTPHDTRHTFSALCEKYGVAENDRKRMLGHSFKNDITNSVYGHRSIEDLRAEIEKIQVPVL